MVAGVVVAPLHVFARDCVAETGDTGGGKDFGHKSRELGGAEGLDVVWRHEQAGVHGVVIGPSGAGDGVDALVVGVCRCGEREGEEADAGFFELAVDLGFASGDLVGRHQVCLGEKNDDVREGVELTKILDINGSEA